MTDLNLTPEEIREAQSNIDMAAVAVIQLHGDIEEELGQPVSISHEGAQYVNMALFSMFAGLLVEANDEDLEKVIVAMTASEVILRGGSLDLQRAMNNNNRED